MNDGVAASTDLPIFGPANLIGMPQRFGDNGSMLSLAPVIGSFH
jgi:hypothetical protein